ncbi:Peptidoglycan/xylan/chitin deacetylase, PgdA/CDA1 family [Parapedobacter composti]|uniref:Peptidoglycan/xylan/chitin deacetylase, PgdA/CDA1 family n=1 Tax=Parapedobacter composti TaxID=623281 RepID=A0A1I1L343_9SPHI|nr:polysaccharide deacetylase family protein [Parapedobacter composti]SFC67459.1 Peptidoglycan/xylan/chitin deacetylase, PgdA/CDA1 family [Parapedobacter composti]
MYTVRSPFILRWLYPKLTWHRSRAEKRIFLTFDDGPIPDVTPFVINTLKTYQVKATFFCVGENIKKHPDLFDMLLENGHRVGNHTYNHLNGWKTPAGMYLENVAHCQQLTQTKLFRPPYGRATRAQLNRLRQDFDVVMWDVLSGDFDTKLRPEKCLQNVIRHTCNGSIVVFHDNVKAVPRLTYALPRAIEHWLNQGYRFGTL